MSGCGRLTRRLAVGEHPADLRDVALPAATRVGIESELDRHVRRRQQGQLLGDVVFVHTPIMKEGCGRDAVRLPGQRWRTGCCGSIPTRRTSIRCRSRWSSAVSRRCIVTASAIRASPRSRCSAHGPTRFDQASSSRSIVAGQSTPSARTNRNGSSGSSTCSTRIAGVRDAQRSAFGLTVEAGRPRRARRAVTHPRSRRCVRIMQRT